MNEANTKIEGFIKNNLKSLEGANPTTISPSIIDNVIKTVESCNNAMDISVVLLLTAFLCGNKEQDCDASLMISADAQSAMMLGHAAQHVDDENKNRVLKDLLVEGVYSKVRKSYS